MSIEPVNRSQITRTSSLRHVPSHSKKFTPSLSGNFQFRFSPLFRSLEENLQTRYETHISTKRTFEDIFSNDEADQSTAEQLKFESSEAYYSLSKQFAMTIKTFVHEIFFPSTFEHPTPKKRSVSRAKQAQSVPVCSTKSEKKDPVYNNIQRARDALISLHKKEDTHKLKKKIDEYLEKVMILLSNLENDRMKIHFLCQISEIQCNLGVILEDIESFRAAKETLKKIKNCAGMNSAEEIDLDDAGSKPAKVDRDPIEEYVSKIKKELHHFRNTANTTTEELNKTEKSAQNSLKEAKNLIEKLDVQSKTKKNIHKLLEAAINQILTLPLNDWVKIPLLCDVVEIQCELGEKLGDKISFRAANKTLVKAKEYARKDWIKETNLDDFFFASWDLAKKELHNKTVNIAAIKQYVSRMKKTVPFFQSDAFCVAAFCEIAGIEIGANLIEDGEQSLKAAESILIHAQETLVNANGTLKGLIEKLNTQTDALKIEKDSIIKIKSILEESKAILEKEKINLEHPSDSKSESKQTNSEKTAYEKSKLIEEYVKLIVTLRGVIETCSICINLIVNMKANNEIIKRLKSELNDAKSILEKATQKKESSIANYKNLLIEIQNLISLCTKAKVISDKMGQTSEPNKGKERLQIDTEFKTRESAKKATEDEMGQVPSSDLKADEKALSPKDIKKIIQLIEKLRESIKQKCLVKLTEIDSKHKQSNKDAQQANKIRILKWHSDVFKTRIESLEKRIKRKERRSTAKFEARRNGYVEQISNSAEKKIKKYLQEIKDEKNKLMSKECPTSITIDKKIQYLLELTYIESMFAPLASLESLQEINSFIVQIADEKTRTYFLRNFMGFIKDTLKIPILFSELPVFIKDIKEINKLINVLDHYRRSFQVKQNLNIFIFQKSRERLSEFSKKHSINSKVSNNISRDLLRIQKKIQEFEEKYDTEKGVVEKFLKPIYL